MLKNCGLPTLVMGAKRRLNSTVQTNKQTHTRTIRLIENGADFGDKQKKLFCSSHTTFYKKKKRLEILRELPKERPFGSDCHIEGSCPSQVRVVLNI